MEFEDAAAELGLWSDELRGRIDEADGHELIVPVQIADEARPLVRRPSNAREPSAPAPRPHSFTTTRSHLRIFDAPGTQLAAEIPG